MWWWKPLAKRSNSLLCKLREVMQTGKLVYYWVASVNISGCSHRTERERRESDTDSDTERHTRTDTYIYIHTNIHIHTYTATYTATYLQMMQTRARSSSIMERSSRSLANVPTMTVKTMFRPTMVMMIQNARSKKARHCGSYHAVTDGLGGVCVYVMSCWHQTNTCWIAN